MCTVSVNVDKALLQNMKPELDSMVAIQLWAQQLIDQRIREMECQDTQSICETLNSSRLASEHRLAQDMSVEELYDVIAKEIDYIYENC